MDFCPRKVSQLHSIVDAEKVISEQIGYPIRIACVGSGDDAAVHSKKGASCFRNAIAWSTASISHKLAVDKILTKGGNCSYAQL